VAAREPSAGQRHVARTRHGADGASLSASELAPVELLALAEPLGIDELTTLAGLEPSVNAEALGLIAINAPADAVRLAHPLRGLPRGADVGERMLALAPRGDARFVRAYVATSPPATAPNCSPSPRSSPRSALCATG
jgi:hypothetical protein